MSGGAGYVLSREALKRFVTSGLHNQKFCTASDTGHEDIEIGLCLDRCGVEFIDTRDRLGRHRFHPLGPGTHLTRGAISAGFWLWSYDYYPSKNVGLCLSVWLLLLLLLLNYERRIAYTRITVYSGFNYTRYKI